MDHTGNMLANKRAPAEQFIGAVTSSYTQCGDGTGQSGWRRHVKASRSSDSLGGTLVDEELGREGRRPGLLVVPVAGPPAAWAGKRGGRST